MSGSILRMAFLCFVVILIVSIAKINIISEKAVQLEQHSPIRINTDNEFTPENGVRRGSGTSEDPYVIENWTIESMLVTTSRVEGGIIIQSTSKHFIIRNCIIYKATQASVEDYVHGIGIYYSQNGIIEKCVILANYSRGIDIQASSNIIVRKNNITNNVEFGLSLMYSHDCIIEDNILDNSINTWETRNNTFIGNKANFIGISYSSFNTLTRNDINVLSLYGTSTDNYIFNNSIEFFDFGNLQEGFLDKNCFEKTSRTANFYEQGLPSGTRWAVTFGKQTKTTTGNSITFNTTVSP